jgi:demethylmenaquinone methyltransferase/2-methoxy-6-polyprenyl-1,4-benzoquinol methylase
MEKMTDYDAYIQRLVEANPLREPVLRAAIQALQLPAGSRGVDIGCGIGLQEFLLAEAVGSAGHVTGVDILPEFLTYGEDLARQADLSERITFREGDMNRLPFEADSFDWAWSADCVGYPAGELTPILQEMMRVVRPGGSIILLAWSSQQVLPGYPLLEARLNATCSSYLPFLKDKRPDQNFLQASRWFQEVGLEDIQAQTFVRTVQAPLPPGERGGLISLFDMLWGQPQPEVSQENWKEYQRLCTPGSADCILDLAGYYAFFTYSMFRGRVPKPKAK